MMVKMGSFVFVSCRSAYSLRTLGARDYTIIRLWESDHLFVKTILIIIFIFQLVVTLSVIVGPRCITFW